MSRREVADTFSQTRALFLKREHFFSNASMKVKIPEAYIRKNASNAYAPGFNREFLACWNVTPLICAVMEVSSTDIAVALLEPVYPCPQCKSAFDSIRGMRHHQKKNHAFAIEFPPASIQAVMKYRCLICTYAFEEESKWKTHQENCSCRTARISGRSLRHPGDKWRSRGPRAGSFILSIHH